MRARPRGFTELIVIDRQRSVNKVSGDGGDDGSAAVCGGDGSAGIRNNGMKCTCLPELTFGSIAELKRC